ICGSRCISASQDVCAAFEVPILVLTLSGTLLPAPAYRSRVPVWGLDPRRATFLDRLRHDEPTSPSAQKRCPRRAIGICEEQFLLLTSEESQQTTADFRFYIENHTRNPDDLSRKQVRIYQLYSRTTGKHVQILGKKVNANGDDGGKYALLVVETETFGSHIRIKGKESEHYICMNEKGKIVGRPDGRKQECVFVEEFLENNYTALVSAKYKGWYLGFNRKGRPKKGSRTTQRQQEVHFMKRQPKGRPDPLEEFRFTTVTKRTRRARRLKPNPKRN
uniref:Fibroblast growth factor n=1 Tax=Gasterosteus aculeatus aculeatus TaxID=481459 RepID=G3PWR4_GASAC